MADLWVRLGVALPLSITLPDAAVGLFPRARIYDEADALVATRDAAAATQAGRYVDGGFTPATPGVYTAHWIVYTDAPHTLESPFYEQTEDKFRVDAVLLELVATHSGVAGSLAEAIALIRGIAALEFYMLDSTIYDSNGFMTSGRIRIFPNAGALAAATDGGVAEGEVFSQTIAGVPDGTAARQPATVKVTSP